MCKCYLEGIYFVFHYYTSELKYWRWFYKYHYPPLMTDFSSYLNSMKGDVHLEESSPSLPFIQLLGVLPSYSKYLLPSKFHKLFDDPKKYPEDFKIDYEGKAKEYEGVVLLPFLDIDEIIKEYEILNKKYNFDKYTRNSRGSINIFTFDPKFKCNFSNEYGILNSISVKTMKEYT